MQHMEVMEPRSGEIAHAKPRLPREPCDGDAAAADEWRRVNRQRHNGDWRGSIGRVGLALRYAGAAIRQRRALWALWKAPAHSILGILVRARPEIWGLLQAPFVSADWTAETRFARILDHCRIIERLGTPFDLRPNQFAELITLDEIGPDQRLTIDQPRWLLRDGLLALSLWQGADRLFSLAFIFGSEGRELVAFIGGVQGRRSARALDLYRAFTRAAHGARPRDMLIELFRMICVELGVSAIHAVSNATRHQRSSYFLHTPGFVDPVRMDYDATWLERGGYLGREGMFDLPVRSPPRAEADIPTRRRGLYRRRREMMASVGARLRAALTTPDAKALQQHEPEWL